MVLAGGRSKNHKKMEQEQDFGAEKRGDRSLGRESGQAAFSRLSDDRVYITRKEDETAQKSIIFARNDTPLKKPAQNSRFDAQIDYEIDMEDGLKQEEDFGAEKRGDRSLGRESGQAAFSRLSDDRVYITRKEDETAQKSIIFARNDTPLKKPAQNSRFDAQIDYEIDMEDGLTGDGYSDDFVRKYFPVTFSATRAKNASNCLRQVYQDFEYKRQIVVACDEIASDTCGGYTFVAHDVSAIFLVFRGTLGLNQLGLEAEETIFNEKISWPGGGSVGFYFARAFNLLWNAGLKNDLLGYIAKNPDYELWIGGHSLGGSLASLASNFLVANGIFEGDKIKLVTFGQPRTGDRDFADSHDRLIKWSYRIVHKKDLVPHIPYNGQVDYRHHRNEIWYNNNMTRGSSYKECDAQESLLCSDSHLDYLIADHHQYFDIAIANYGKRDCTGDPSQ
ncbi:unnamed protein product [Caenorhabditis angaria]|uniref:Fungal lipase-type domain-containing protein n=1 Tax=Caenorhabditis angaria TaxID=860376 RepID=A0A9P1N3P7_9PELO|nr:unnamed protein product [Caenorhabditis angaria]